MRPRTRQPFFLPLVVLTVIGYALGASPSTLGVAATLLVDAETAPCGCTGGNCCGKSCCAEPEEPALSCCEETPLPAAPGPAWDAACTCGSRAHHHGLAPGCDHHVLVAPSRPGPPLVPSPTPTPENPPACAPFVDPDDPVPRHAS